MGCGVRWGWGTWAGVRWRHAEGVREGDGGNCSQTGHQLLGEGLDTAPPPSPSRLGGSGSAGMGTAGGIWGGRVLPGGSWCFSHTKPMQVVQCNPCLPPPFPSGGGGPWDMFCLSPGFLGFISLGCIAVGAADGPRKRGPACAGACLHWGRALYLLIQGSKGPTVQPGSSGIWGFLCPSHQCAGGPVACAWPLKLGA